MLVIPILVTPGLFFFCFIFSPIWENWLATRVARREFRRKAEAAVYLKRTQSKPRPLLDRLKRIIVVAFFGSVPALGLVLIGELIYYR